VLKHLLFFIAACFTLPVFRIGTLDAFQNIPKMKLNESLRLSAHIHKMLQSDLLHAFQEHFPLKILEEQAKEFMPDSRERTFTPTNPYFTKGLFQKN